MAQFAQHTNKIDSLSSYYILTLEHSLRSFSFYSTFLLPFVSSPSKTVIRNKGPHPLSQFLPCDAAEAPSISRVGHKSCNPYPFKNQRSPLDKEYTVSVHSTRARARGKENSYQIAFNVSDDKRLRQGERRGDRDRERLYGENEFLLLRSSFLGRDEPPFPGRSSLQGRSLSWLSAVIAAV